jgi:hypothetical protein
MTSFKNHPRAQCELCNGSGVDGTPHPGRSELEARAWACQEAEEISPEDLEAAGELFDRIAAQHQQENEIDFPPIREEL